MAEALETLASGQCLMIRQGTAAHNLQTLTELFKPPYYQRAMLVTDDKHPGDLLQGGHIDGIIRKAVELGADPVRAIKMGTYNPACFFGLKNSGAVAPGYLADLVIFDPDRTWRVEEEEFASRASNSPFTGSALTGKVVYTICKGEVVYEELS